MELYVVIMYRYGNTERHSYLLGVYDDPVVALKQGESESVYRGRKYYPEVMRVGLNDTKKREYVIRAKRAMTQHDDFKKVLAQYKDQVLRG